MTTFAQQSYSPQKWDLAGLDGISDHTLQVHFGLYEGYVKNTNLLNEQLSELGKNGQAVGSNPIFAELSRRLGFEYNGMRLHEYYFGNMTKKSGGSPDATLKDALAVSFDDFDGWKKDFAAIGGMRGVGWAIAYQDPWTTRISNHWVTLHEDGNVAGFTPLLVMDVWEHAFIFDYKPAERTQYVEAFFRNIDWSVMKSRLKPRSVS